MSKQDEWICPGCGQTYVVSPTEGLMCPQCAASAALSEQDAHRIMASEHDVQWDRREGLEALVSQGNLYPGTEEIEAAEGPDWWKSDDDEDDPEDD